MYHFSQPSSADLYSFRRFLQDPIKLAPAREKRRARNFAADTLLPDEATANLTLTAPRVVRWALTSTAAEASPI